MAPSRSRCTRLLKAERSFGRPLFTVAVRGPALRPSSAPVVEGPSINEGITGLVVNVAVLLLVQAGLVLTGRRTDDPRTEEPVPEPVT